MICVLICWCMLFVVFFFFKQKTAYEMRISDWSSDVCSSDLLRLDSPRPRRRALQALRRGPEDRERGRGMSQPNLPPARDEGRQREHNPPEIGRASCRERVCQYV